MVSRQKSNMSVASDQHLPEGDLWICVCLCGLGAGAGGGWGYGMHIGRSKNVKHRVKADELQIYSRMMTL